MKHLMATKEETDKLYDMGIHEAIRISECLIVIRVPGGWIYEIDNSKNTTHTFVPYVEQILI